MAVKVVEISGPARERGRQYGEQAREQIARAIEWYSESFQATAGLTWEQVRPQTLNWVPLIEAYNGPDLIEEVRGVAEGAGFTFEDILALNGRGELHTGNPFADKEVNEEECSSFALLPEATADGHTYAGQNWDWQSSTTDTVMMLRIEQPGRPTVVMQVEAGQVGRQGANSAGIALNANGIGPRFGQKIGLPGPFVRRKILDSWTMNEALEAVFGATQSFSTNLLLTHRDGFAIDLETTPGRHQWAYPEEGVLVHGNHFEWFIPPQIEGTYKPFSPDSLYRVFRIRQGMAAARFADGSAGVRDVIARTMADHFGLPEAVCAHPNLASPASEQYQTVASSMVDLTEGTYRLAWGNPCTAPYEVLPFNLYDGPSIPEAGLVAAAAN